MNDKDTTAENGDSALQAMTQVVDSYIIQNGPATGLIKMADIDFAIVEALVAYFRHTPDSLGIMDRLSTSREFHRAFSALHESLAGKVWTGRMFEKEEKDGEKTTTKAYPETKTPRCGINYETDMAKRVQEMIIEDYRPMTPTLAHTPDAKRYLEICKALFPNVVKPYALANGLRNFIENVHNSCNTEGAEFAQKALWLYSLKTGGVGKSHFINNLVRACDKLGIDSHRENFGGQWLSPTIGFHTITISEDTPKLDTSTAETLNKLIDRSEFGYNIKFGASGNAKSYTTMLLASNYESYESNTRRYDQVEYLQTNLETLTPDEKTKYFPLWNDNEKAVDLIAELFTVCPFKSEHAPWTKVKNDMSDILSDASSTRTEEKVDVGTRYYSTLLAIQETLDGDYENCPDFTRMRPCKFAKYMAETCGCKRDDAPGRLVTFLAELMSKDQLRSNKCEGRTPILTLPIDWTVFATRFSCGDFDENEGNPLDAIANEWDALIASENE